MLDHKDKRPRRAVHVSLDAALVEEARRYGIALSGTLNAALERAVEAERERRWREENREAIESYNRFIETHGLLADKLRYRPEDDTE